MKRLMILGILLSCLIPALTSCCIDPLGVELPDTGNPNTIYKTFGGKQTKAQVYFTWENGMNICVYSLDAEGKVMFKDTCVVKNASGSGSSSHATIEAEVAKGAETYFACYPYNILDAEVGEVMNYNYKATGEGKLKDVYIGAATAINDKNVKETAPGTFVFKPQNSIIYVGSTIVMKVNLAVFDLHLNVYSKDYPSGRSVVVPKSYNYSDSNPFYIHVATHTGKVGVSGKATFANTNTAIWKFSDNILPEIEPGEFKQYSPSAISK